MRRRAHGDHGRKLEAAATSEMRDARGETLADRACPYDSLHHPTHLPQRVAGVASALPHLFAPVNTKRVPFPAN